MSSRTDEKAEIIVGDDVEDSMKNVNALLKSIDDNKINTAVYARVRAACKYNRHPGPMLVVATPDERWRRLQWMLAVRELNLKIADMLGLKVRK